MAHNRSSRDVLVQCSGIPARDVALSSVLIGAAIWQKKEKNHVLQSKTGNRRIRATSCAFTSCFRRRIAFRQSTAGMRCASCYDIAIGKSFFFFFGLLVFGEWALPRHSLDVRINSNKRKMKFKARTLTRFPKSTPNDLTRLLRTFWCAARYTVNIFNKLDSSWCSHKTNDGTKTYEISFSCVTI